MIKIIRIKKSDYHLQEMMKKHYSQPRGFVGRQIFYKILWNDTVYGCIGFGSAVRHLPGRGSRLIERGLNNIFYHIEKIDGKYPCRNFTTKALLLAEQKACVRYALEYNDPVEWLETLVELPRTGDLYLKAGYSIVGQTVGYTCKRKGGFGTDSWSGKRYWNTENLRPKLVLLKEVA